MFRKAVLIVLVYLYVFSVSLAIPDLGVLHEYLVGSQDLDSISIESIYDQIGSRQGH